MDVTYVTYLLPTIFTGASSCRSEGCSANNTLVAVAIYLSYIELKLTFFPSLSSSLLMISPMFVCCNSLYELMYFDNVAILLK